MSETEDRMSRASVAVAPVQGAESPSATEAYEMAGDSQDVQPVPEIDYPSGSKLWLVLLTTGAVLILASIDMNIIATALPSITGQFHTSRDVGWYSSAFRLCLCAFQFVFGKAYGLFSVKRVFLIANGIAICGALLSGSARSSMMLVVGRAVAGVGAAGLFSGCVVILVQSVPLRRRPAFLGIMGGVEGVASLGAPLLGGAITESLNWRWCFYITAPIGLATFLLTIYCFSDAPKAEDISALRLKDKISQLDLVSNLLLIPSLTSLFLALSWGGMRYPWHDARIIATFVVFGCLLTAFIYNQVRRGHTATFPPHIVKHRAVIAGSIFITFLNSAGTILDYYLPTYYQIARDYSPVKSGYMMLPISIGGTLGSLIHGAGTSMVGYYAPFMILGSILMPVALGLMTTLGETTTLAQMLVYSSLAGFAYGIGFSGPQNAVHASLPSTDVPLGLAIMLFCQSFGPAIAVPIGQALFSSKLTKSLDNLGIGLNETDMAAGGLREILQRVPSTSFESALDGFEDSLSQIWYLAVALSCVALVGSLTVEWKSVKTKRD